MIEESFIIKRVENWDRISAQTKRQQGAINIKRFTLWLLILCFFLSSVSQAKELKLEEVVTPYVGDQFYLSVKGSPPSQITHENGRVEGVISTDSILYMEIVGASRSYELSGYRSYMKWDNENLRFYPPIEYRKMYSTDGKTELGYRFVLAFDFSELPFLDEFTKLSGEALIGPRMSGKLPSQPFSLTLQKETNFQFPTLYQHNPNQPIFQSSNQNGSAAIQLGDVAVLNFDCDDMWDVNLSYTTVAKDFVQEAYEGYKLKFLSFTYRPVFNQRAQLMIPAQEGSVVYQLIDTTLHPLEAEYDKELSVLIFDRLSLGDYVVSSQPLPPLTLIRKANPINGAVA